MQDGCRDLEIRYHNKVRLHHFDVDIEDFNSLEKLNTFRIASDLLTVLARYGDATRIELGAYYERVALRLKVIYNRKAYADIVDISDHATGKLLWQRVRPVQNPVDYGANRGGSLILLTKAICSWR